MAKAAAVDARGELHSMERCPRCGGLMAEMHCKIACLKCGYMRDCNDQW